MAEKEREWSTDDLGVFERSAILPPTYDVPKLIFMSFSFLTCKMLTCEAANEND